MKFPSRPGLSLILRLSVCGLTFSLPLCQAVEADEADQKPPVVKSFMVISTGTMNSDEYLLGSTICKLINYRSKDTNIYCSITASGSAVMNVDRLRRGNANFIILKSSKILEAVKGSSSFSNPKPYRDLRIVMTGFTKDLTLLGSKNLKVEKLSDLEKHPIDVDDDPDGAAPLLELVNSESKDILTLDKKNTDFPHQIDTLCSDSAETAAAIEIAHKNDELYRFVDRCHLKVAGLDEELIKRITIKNPYLSPTVIAAKTYQNQPYDLLTIGEGVSIVTPKTTDARLVNNLLTSVIEQLTKFRSAMPFLRNANILDMRPKLDFIALYPGIEPLYDK